MVRLASRSPKPAVSVRPSRGRGLLACALLSLEPLGAEEPAPSQVDVDPAKRTVTLPAVVGRVDGDLAYVLVAKEGKEDAALFVTSSAVLDLERALRSLRVENGRPAAGKDPPRGVALRVLVELAAADRDGKPASTRRPVEDFVLRRKVDAAGKEPWEPLDAGVWAFTGSRQDDRQVLECARTKSLVGFLWADASPLVQNARPEAAKGAVYRARRDLLPPPGTPVRLVFEVPLRVHLRISGKVQGVGFRDFTRRHARELGLAGWVRNLDDGRVEAVVEGPPDKVDRLLEKLARGPSAARVDKVERNEESPTGGHRDFEVRREDR